VDKANDTGSDCPWLLTRSHLMSPSSGPMSFKFICLRVLVYVFLSFPLVFDIKGEEMMGFYNAAVKCQRTNLKREKDVKDDCVRLWWSPVYRRCNFSRFTGDLRHRYNYDSEWLFQSILGCAPLNQGPGCASPQ